MGKNTRADIEHQEKMRWLNNLRRQIDGLAAQAEAQSEGCESEWMCMQYGLENALALLDSIIDEEEHEHVQSESV